VGPGEAATVAVLVRPYAQRALLDGVEVAAGVQQVAFQLAPGRPHRIRIEHACCEPFEREFPAAPPLPPRLELRVPLEPRPARLRVEAEEEARVFVDGRLVGTAGESRRRPLLVAVPPSGASPYEGAGEVRVEAPGRPAHVSEVRFRAGADLTVVAPRALPAPPAPEPDPADGADATGEDLLAEPPPPEETATDARRARAAADPEPP
jgi:serine/threonine-protein kinase